MPKSRDQDRRVSPKVTVTMPKEELEFLDGRWSDMNPKIRGRSGLVTEALKRIRIKVGLGIKF